MPATLSLVTAVEAACRAGGDPVSLRSRVLRALKQTVRFDYHAFLLTDPETGVGCSPVARVPDELMPSLPEVIRLRYLSAATGGSQWREFLARHGIADVATVVFSDRHGTWGWLDLWRAGDPFTAAERQALDALCEPVTEALRHSQAETFITAPARPPRPGPVVLLLSRDLTVLRQTPETNAYLRQLVPPPEGQQPIPAGAYNVGAQVLANEAGTHSRPAWARVHLASGLWMTLRATTMGDAIAVSIEESSPAERVDLFTRACGLSPREAELFGHLVKGQDTKEIATMMYLSEHTVQDHLKSIFAKTGERSRKTLIARALGT